MQTTHHAGKIAAIQQSFVPRIVASHLLLSRKQVSPSFTSPAHLVVRQKKSKLLLDGFAPIFPDTCYHLTHYWLAAVDIPV
ncbi:hypothetical protein, partial [Escherichia coli]|uniref:hypothetical protein n=1 Tax=Escherichia coli TaxID=562 RepID=UPI001BFCABBD